ncbi:unnamed protein product [Schistosoma curassoni]|uniref:Uncharacterized protein n=1 Tax=Schistosoma curassoni TaxID=6186 RepID=A0A183KZ41_9TREM|nr:unnamed protein product [Schistosoma curassoni]
MHRCDDYNVAQELKVCLATVLGYNTNIATNDETQPCDAKKPKRTVKRKLSDYLCTSEELEVAEVEAGFAPVEFPVVNNSTGTFSPIASSSSKANLSSPPILRTSTEGDKPLPQFIHTIKSLPSFVRCIDSYCSSENALNGPAPSSVSHSTSDILGTLNVWPSLMVNSLSKTTH